MEAHYARQIAKYMFNREVLLNRSFKCVATPAIILSPLWANVNFVKFVRCVGQ